MNTVGTTFLLITVGAIATAFCIKKNAMNVNFKSADQQADEEYVQADVSDDYDDYDMFYSTFQPEPMQTTVTGSVYRNP